MFRLSAPRGVRAWAMAAVIVLVAGVARGDEGRHPQDGKTVAFNPAFLPGGPAMKLDLSRYSRRNPVMPGVYDADVWLNGEWQVRRRVRFAAAAAGARDADAVVCIPAAELASFGVTLSDATKATEDGACRSLSDYLAGASTRFDVSEQRLDIEVPQAALARPHVGVVPLAQRDAGIASGQMAWRLNLHRSTMRGRTKTAHFLAHEAGINAGHWRVRGAGSWSTSRYVRRHLYVEHQVEAWQAQWRTGAMTLADGMFTPIRMVGTTLASDPRMNDSAGAGYKPTVRGLARTHALVRVSQGDVLLRELSVPPGPFLIDDLQGLGHGGDLKVTVDEEDGSRTSFRVPFFAMPELLGPGRTMLALSAGRSQAGRGPGGELAQATWRRGFAWDTTLFSGVRHAKTERSLLIGGAIDTLAGAFALDVSHAGVVHRSAIATANRAMTRRLRHGRRWRGGTTTWLGWTHEGGRSGEERIDVTLQRELSADAGMLAASASMRRTRRPTGPRRATGDRSYAIAWTRGWQRATLDVSLRHAVDDVSARIGISMPLGPASSAPSMTAAGSGARRGGNRLQMGATGVAGPEGAWGYGASVGQGSGGHRRVGVSASHMSTTGESSVAVDRSDASHGESFSTSGALVIHRHGVTQAQRLGEAMALVRATGAMGGRLPSSVGARLDRRGYGVVSYLAPFRWNAVEIDPTGLSLDVAVLSTRRRVAPTAGAIVLVPFETEVGRTALLVARRPDGSPPAFGANVIDPQGRSVGVVGQTGNIFVRRVEPGTALTIRWGRLAEDQCVIKATTKEETVRGLARLAGVCE